MINQFDAFGISMDHSRGRLSGRVSFPLIRPLYDRMPCPPTHGSQVRVCEVWPTLTGLSGQARFESGMFNRGVSMMALSSRSPTPTVELGYDGVPWTYHPSCYGSLFTIGGFSPPNGLSMLVWPTKQAFGTRSTSVRFRRCRSGQLMYGSFMGDMRAQTNSKAVSTIHHPPLAG